MTREEFVKRSIKAYMVLDYRHSRMDESVEVYVCAVDFDTEIIMIQSFDNPPDAKPVPCHISMLHFPKKKLKVIK